jgi:hypothetical protein
VKNSSVQAAILWAQVKPELGCEAIIGGNNRISRQKIMDTALSITVRLKKYLCPIRPVDNQQNLPPGNGLTTRHQK